MKKLFHLFGVVFVLTCMSIPAHAYEADALGGVNIHGFISQGYILSDEYNYLVDNSKDGSFDYNEVGLNFSKSLTDQLRMSLQLFSRDLGDVANNKVNLDYAYGDYRWRDWMGLRIGKIRIPLGLWNEIRDYDMLRPWIVLPQHRYNELIRDAMVALNGAGVYGNVPAGVVGSFDYYLLTGIINPDADQGYGKYLSNIFRGTSQMNGEPEAETMFAGSLKWQTPLPGLMIGAWAFKIEITAPLTGEYSGTTYDFDLAYEKLSKGLMLEYSWNDLSLWAEYYQDELKSSILGSMREYETEPEGWYVGCAYRFTDWFQLGAYYSEGYADGDDKDGDNQAAMLKPDHAGWQKDLALTFRFDLNEYVVLKLEGHKVDGIELVIDGDNTDTDNDFSESDWYYGAAKLTVSF